MTARGKPGSSDLDSGEPDSIAPGSVEPSSGNRGPAGFTSAIGVSASPGCGSPILGRHLSAALGQAAPLAPLLRRHLAGCLACQLERRAFANLEGAAAVPPSAALRARLLRVRNRILAAS